VLVERHAALLDAHARTSCKPRTVNRTVPLILAVALFMENMDATVISTSLPAIAADIGTSPITLKLALTTYFVALAIFIPVSGWMADRFGAKRVFRWALGVFVVGSVLCAMSGSLLEFVLSRFAQGMGGAMMVPVARLVLVRATPKNELVGAMAWLTIPALFGPLVGPPVGGFITTFISWHWIFLINVPIGLAGIWVAGRVLPEMKSQEPGRIDVKGFFLAAVAASGVVFGLSVVSMPALPPAVGGLTLLVGIAASFAYLRHARAVAAPLLDMKLFANPVLRASVIGNALFRIGSGAVPFLLPLMFQIGFGLSPFQSGMLTFVSAFGAIAMKFLAQWTLRLAGFRSVLLVTTLMSALLIGFHGFFAPDTPYAVILIVLVASGLMRSLFFTSANTLVFAEIDDREASQTTAISAVTQQISVAIGVAVAGLLLEAHGLLTGETLGLAAFSWAFFAVGLITATALVPFVALSSTAGQGVSGHVTRRRVDDPPSVP
jgi:EmrB/QacA subfamily drug resistance transporter